MSDLSFEWDPRKAAANAAKHGVTFEEASTVFADDFALIIDDPEHSRTEDRSIILGLSANARMLVVVHCERSTPLGKAIVIRIISARKATRAESQDYFKRSQP